MEMPSDGLERDKLFNSLAKDLFKIDFKNTEFHFVMLSALLMLLLNKGVITEEEFAAATEEAGTAFKLMKYRNDLQEKETE